MDGFSAPIVQQPRLLMVVPVIIIGIAVVAAGLISWAAARLGAARAGGAAAVLCFVGGIVAAIASSRGAQGTVRVEGGNLELDGRWRSARQVALSGAQVTPVVWRRGAPANLVVGGILDVRGGGGRITIGAADPSLAEQLRQGGAGTTTIPPSATVAPEHFRQLMRLLGAEVQGTRGP